MALPQVMIFESKISLRIDKYEVVAASMLEVRVAVAIDSLVDVVPCRSVKSSFEIHDDAVRQIRCWVVMVLWGAGDQWSRRMRLGCSL